MKAVRYFPWVAGAFAVAVIGTTIYFSRAIQPAVPAGVPLSPVVDPTVLVQRYQEGLSALAQELAPLMERELTAADRPALRSAHDRAMKLTVPRGEQQHHLKFVLALSRLIELLEPSRVVVASASAAPTVGSTQAELLQYLALSKP